MLGYLSADIICSEKRTVFRERSSRKTVSYEEQIMSKDKYPGIFSPQMEAIEVLHGSHVAWQEQWKYFALERKNSIGERIYCFCQAKPLLCLLSVKSLSQRALLGKLGNIRSRDVVRPAPAMSENIWRVITMNISWMRTDVCCRSTKPRIYFHIFGKRSY